VTEERRITELLASALADEMPNTNARRVVSNLPAHPRRSKAKVWLAAACLLVALPIVSVQMPLMARALCQVPVVGTVYSKFIESSGMDIAYQAGLVTELNRSVTQSGVTLTILSAYSDAAQGVVFFTLSSEERDILERIWDNGHLQQDIMRGKNPAFGIKRSSSYELLVEDNMIMGVINTASVSGLFSKKLTLRLTSQALNTSWQVTFPVQTVPSTMNSTLRINQSFTYQGDKFIIESATFTPSRTLISYTQEYAPERINDGPPIDEKSGGIKHESNMWSLIDSEGKELQNFGSSFGSDGKVGRGELYFAPSQDPKLSLMFNGVSLMFEHVETIDLLPGSYVETSQGVLQINDLEPNATTTMVSLEWQGNSKLQKLEAEIIDAHGNSSRIAGWDESNNYITLSFVHPELSKPLMLRVSTFYIHIPLEQKVCEIAR